MVRAARRLFSVSACVVNADVDATKLGDGGGNRCFDLVFVPDIAEERQSLSASFLDFSRCRVDRPRQGRMRLGALGPGFYSRQFLRLIGVGSWIGISSQQ
jgi:hypothetical protein